MKTFFSDERGQGLVEYGLILGLIAMVAVGALLMLGNNVNSSIGNGLDPSTSSQQQPGTTPFHPHGS